jgi:hypothetical protein
MTLTPPKIGDLAARCRAQRLLEKNPWRASNSDGEKIARLLILWLLDAPEKVGAGTEPCSMERRNGDGLKITG